MALTGQLSDLSLAELIEFFCNQRKSGRLKVMYPRAPGYFYFQNGSLVDAKIGALRGVEAVYYALTLDNASFKFSAAFEATQRTIHQPWAQVALEGLRRMDEGIAPSEAFPAGEVPDADEPEEIEVAEVSADSTNTLVSSKDDAPVDIFDLTGDPAAQEIVVEGNAAQESSDVSSVAPMSLTVGNAARSGRSRAMLYGAVVVAVLICVMAVGVPAGWFKGKAAKNAAPAQQAGEQASSAGNSQSDLSSQTQDPPADSASKSTNEAQPSDNAAAAAAKREARQREMLRAAEEQRAGNAPQIKPQTQTPTPATVNAEAKKPEPAKAGPKMVSVQVTYDDAGRVTQTSGGDGTAQRIARQKRFPPGKGGSTTVTIPVN